MRIFDLILVFVFISWFGNVLNSQIDSTQIFYNELKEELFPASQKMIPLYEYLGTNCSRIQIDSTIMIRAEQPDPIKVVHLLKRIEYSKDGNYFNPLLEIYHLHVKIYLKEYYILYNKLQYHSSDPCEPISYQYDILAAFEEALKSLYLNYKKFSTKEIFDFYINEKLLIVEAVYHQKPELFNDYLYFYNEFSKLHDPFRSYELLLDKFNDINKNKIDPYDNYIYPYYNELKPYFVDYLLNCDCSKKDNVSNLTDSCLSLVYTIKFIAPIEDDRIFKYFEENYISLMQNWKGRLIYLYAGYHYNKEYSDFFADKLIENSLSREFEEIRTYIGLFIVDDRNYSLMLSRILLLAESDYEKALKYFKALDYDPGNNLNEKTLKKIELIKKLRHDSRISNK